VPYILIEYGSLVHIYYPIGGLPKENVKDTEKLVAGPRWVPDTKTDWPTDCRSQYNFGFDFDLMYRKYKRLKLGGGQAYDRSSD
jgi:hypothetical protein